MNEIIYLKLCTTAWHLVSAQRIVMLESEAGNLGSGIGQRLPEMVNGISCRERET